MAYSDKHIGEYVRYLQYSVKHGYMDEEVANDIIRRKAWGEVQELMELGDEAANDNEREESDHE